MTYLDRTDNFIESLGFEDSWLVGGAIRSSKLGLRAKDADYVIRGAKREDIRRRVRRTGADTTDLKLRDGRIVGVRAAKKGLGLIEICMPRTERKVAPKFSEAGNTRHAFEIVVDPSVTLEQDAVRRDFTVNALYRHVGTREVVDPTGRGLADLEGRVLRTTHESSFRDDPLRTLRALRFLAVLPDFSLSDDTLHQMMLHSDAVTGLTGKGVSGTALEELEKMLMGENVAKALRVGRDTGVIQTLLPELHPMMGFGQDSKYHTLTVDEHTFTALDWAARANLSLRVRLALLFHDSGKPESSWRGDDGYLHFYEHKDHPGSEDHAIVGARKARAALKRLNAPNDLRRDVPLLIERHMVPLSGKVKPAKVRKWRCELGDELLTDLFKHRLADCAGKDMLDYDDVQALARMEQIHNDAIKRNIPKSPKDLKDRGLISGHDLLEMGVKGGPDMASILNQLLHEVVAQPDRADREWLLGRAKRLAGVS